VSEDGTRATIKWSDDDPDTWVKSADGWKQEYDTDE